MKIIIDTNALLYAAKNKLDIFNSLRKKYGPTSIVLLESVERELKKLTIKAEKASDRQAASLAIRLIQKHIPFPTVAPRKAIENVDSTLLELAKDNGWAILTNDLELRNKAKRQGIKTFVIRQKKLIE